MIEKVIIFDASTIISLAMNGLYEEISLLKSIFKGRFIITKEVKYEIIDRPLTIKKFELEALKLQKLLQDGVFELPSSLGVSDSEVSKEAQSILDLANKTFYGDGREMRIVDLGETSCLALSKILNGKGISSVLAVDERTMRMLVEKPDNLDKLLSKKLNTKIKANRDYFKYFKGFNFIRSSELVYVLYKKGLTKLKGPMVLDALLYAVKFKGCSISGDEIREIKSLGEKGI
ncbi:MAG: hypothetical protein KKB31_03350 [Nanoarchaeota archaeon]|nr:hypothetical protein [Nanoarchaeota archaeon]